MIILALAEQAVYVCTKFVLPHANTACSAGADMIVYDRGLLLLAGLV